MSHILGIKKENIKKILEEIYHQRVEILKISKLGSGFMATGFRVDFRIKKEIKKIVIRVLNPVDFSNDYPPDRMASFWIQHHSAKSLPHHIKSLGIIGIEKNSSAVSVDHFHEFLQVLEWAEGEEYSVDLERILKENHATKQDLKRVIMLSNYLARVHQKKYKGPQDQALSLYKRHTRDYIGSRFVLDVLDTYPLEISFTTWNKLHQLVFEIFKYREKFKNNFQRLSKIHGDIHPGNIRFYTENKFTVLDASRAIWGEPADDVSCLGINYLWYALKQTGSFKGVFRELFDAFWNNYLEKTEDQEIARIMPLFIAIRGIVLKHPLYFSVDDSIRRKLLAFSFKALKGQSLKEALNLK